MIADGAGSYGGGAAGLRLCYRAPITRNCNAGKQRLARVRSDAQNCVVGVFDLLVGPGKTVAGVVDLVLGEILDHEEMLNGIARLAQFAVSCDHVGAIDHETRLVPMR